MKAELFYFHGIFDQNKLNISNASFNNHKKYNIYIMVTGNDWKGKFDFMKEYCQVIYLERTPNISSTQIKEKIKLC